MTNSWTREDIEAIMVQLNKQELPFKKYEFSALGAGMSLLGSGASANVYEAVAKGKSKKKFAIKVIGFGNKHVDSEAFVKSVEVQKNLGNTVDNIVKIYDSVELRLWIEGEHDVVKTEVLHPWEEANDHEGNCLHLQFVLMEKVLPVLKTHRFGHELTPYRLELFDENEIIKLAYDIGIAIDKAHRNNLIHRDIKLENIFYDINKRCYKLGDFGIARTTDDGMASTVAFTKGYGAPEVVGTLDDRYDFTADIYSFGMMLYVLLNELRFPESTGYHPTVYQYMQGYVPPEPVKGSDEFVSIVLKMLSFDPDDRYQTMEEVLNEFDEMKFGHRFKYQREHKSAALTIGTVLALMGAAVWKMSFMPNLVMNFNWGIYVFCTLCLGKSVLTLLNKKKGFVDATLFGLGIYLMFSITFKWWYILLLLFMLLFDYLPGVISGCLLISNVVYIAMTNNNLNVQQYSEYRWIAVLLISLACVLLFLNFVLEERDDTIYKRLFNRNMFWIITIAWFVLLIVLGKCLAPKMLDTSFFFERILGYEGVQWILSWKPVYVGLYGAAFSLIWPIREWLLSSLEKNI